MTSYCFHYYQGYPTASHRSALYEHGPCEIYRFSYAPVKNAVLRQEQLKAVKNEKNTGNVKNEIPISSSNNCNRIDRGCSGSGSSGRVNNVADEVNSRKRKVICEAKSVKEERSSRKRKGSNNIDSVKEATTSRKRKIISVLETLNVSMKKESIKKAMNKKEVVKFSKSRNKVIIDSVPVLKLISVKGLKIKGNIGHKNKKDKSDKKDKTVKTVVAVVVPSRRTTQKSPIIIADSTLRRSNRLR